MSILFAAMLASAQPLPFIDRASLNTMEKIEALRPVRAARPQAAAKKLLQGDMRAIATICGAAGNQTDPVQFLSIIGDVYSMAPSETASLRSTCAVCLSGRLDGSDRKFSQR